ncbi:MAG: BatA domain-containing protein [Planctomycetota bacterium]
MFANPVALWGLLAAAVPVIIHLIFRRKRQAIDFPTLMFFQRVDMKLASRRKVKELLLLILRVAAIFLVVLALARPGFHSKEQSGGSADCVLIIDNSGSMGLPAHTGTRLELARAQANAVLNVPGGESKYAILPTVPGDPACEVTSFMAGADRDLLYKALQALYPTNGSGSLTSALGQAKDLILSSTAPNREVYILSDLQANLFKDQQALRDAVAALPPGTTVFLCPVPGGAPENNASIVNLSMDPRPKVAGRMMRVEATVKNNSLREISTAVTATLRDAKPVSATATLVAGATQVVPLVLTLGQEGFTWGDVKLDNDDAAYDNVWPFCLEIRGPIRALVVAPALPRRAEMGEAFYLLKALDPTGDGRLSGIKVDNVTQDKLPKELDPYDAVIICGSRSFAPSGLKTLADYVERGGGLMLFSSAQDAQLAANHPLQSFFGGKILGELSVLGNQKALGLQVLRPASPYFDDCRTLEGSVEFQEVAVLHALRVEPGPDTEVLAQFSSGQPAILAHRRKQGRILWLTTSPHTEDSNLPLMPQFLSFLHRSISFFAGAQGLSLSQMAGHPLTFDLSTRARKDGKAVYPAVVTVFDPTEKSFEVPVKGGRIEWKQTGRVGVYRMAAKPAEGKAAQQPTVPVPGGFAVTPDPEESMPEYRPPDDAKRALGLPSALVLDPSADLNTTVGITRQGRELFGYFIFGSLLMILAEVLVANMLGVRMKAPQQQFLAGPGRAATAAVPGLSLQESTPKPEPAPAETGVQA